MKHLVVFTDTQIQKVLGGQLKYDIRFYKKRPEFLNKLSVGDIIYFRKRGEVIGQFEVGKIVIIENLEFRDWKLLKEYGFENIEYRREKFEEDIKINTTILIIQITKLEQFITSPIEINKRSKTEWILIE